METAPAEAAQQLRAALALWRGHPYADVPGPFPLELEARRLEELRLRAVELRIEAELALGRHAQLVAELEVLCEEFPVYERFRGQHMLALYRSGRQAEALRAYQKTRTYLAEELGLEPSAQLQELERAILNQDPSLLLEPEPQVQASRSCSPMSRTRPSSGRCRRRRCAARSPNTTGSCSARSRRREDGS